MNLYSLTILLILFTSGCQKSDINLEDNSDCIDLKIEAFKTSNLPCESGKTIYRYKFQDEFVYVFGPGNCGADMMSDVYNEECNLVCGLGGIAGNLMCNGENFHDGATDETLIWKN